MSRVPGREQWGRPAIKGRPPSHPNGHQRDPLTSAPIHQSLGPRAPDMYALTLANYQHPPRAGCSQGAEFDLGQLPSDSTDDGLCAVVPVKKIEMHAYAWEAGISIEAQRASFRACCCSAALPLRPGLHPCARASLLERGLCCLVSAVALVGM